MLTTIILTVILWILFFLAELAASAFYPHPFIIEYFPNDVKRLPYLNFCKVRKPSKYYKKAGPYPKIRTCRYLFK